jgi:hypothetical protein
VYRGLGIGVLLIGYFGYDYWYYKRSRDDVELEHVKKLLEGQEGDYDTKKRSRYIEQRAKINMV